jgi:O-antigen/teichoic acid export membrane protein
LEFKELGYCEMIPMIVFAVVSVVWTYYVRDVWALVYSSIVLTAVNTAVSYRYSVHSPRLNFSWVVAHPMFSFGLCLLGITLMQTVREQGVVFVLSKGFSLEDLGLYNRAVAFSLALFIQAQAMFWRVIYPAFSAINAEPERLRRVWMRMNSLVGLVAAPVAGIYVIASPLVVEVALGDKWLPIVPMLRIFAVYALITALAAPSEVLFQSLGRPALGTRIHVLGVVVLGIALWPCIRVLGIEGAAVAFVASGVVVTTVTCLVARRLVRQPTKVAGSDDVCSGSEVGWIG